MKINKNSWHFKVMAYYRYIRFMRLDSTERPQSWFNYTMTQNHMHGHMDDISYDDYVQYLEASNGLPVDFCTYWRGVILWPLWHCFAWLSAFSVVGFMLSKLDFSSAVTQLGVIVAIIVGFIALFIAIFLFTELIKKLVKRQKPKEKDGFFAKVKTSVQDHNVCSIIEYED